jgi:acetyl esterase/lipase
LKAVISIYGPTDLAWAHAHPFVPDVVRGTEALEAYLGGTPEEVRGAYEMATPQTWVRRAQGRLPATLLIHGTGEHCVRARNAEMLAKSLVEKGQRIKVILLPFTDHGFDVRSGGFGEQVARGAILNFLREQL